MSGCVCAPFSSQVILRQVQRECSVRLGEKSLCSPDSGWWAGWWVLCPECLGHFLQGRLGLAAGSSVSVGANWSHHGVPGEGLRPSHSVASQGPRLEATWWASSSLTIYTPRSTSQPKHSTICLVGQVVARSPRTWEPGTSILSRADVWCRVHGWLLDHVSAHRHGGAGFVSQAILYFNFRCIS